MTYIENIFLCLALPLILSLFFMKGRVRRYALFLTVGMAVCLLSAYVNSFFMGQYGVDGTVSAIEITPVCEEVMKLLPLLFFYLIFEPEPKEMPAAAIAIAHAVGVSLDDADALHAIESVRIAGRMEQFRDPQSNTLAIVDYAHNYASVTALLDFVYERWGEENPRITLVTGSAGNKAYDRRKEIVEAAENRIANFIFTAEDTDTEPIIDICMEMQGYITNKDVVSTVISDRLTAITNAIYDARAHADRFNILLIIGKGNERWIKDHRKHVPFDGDDHVVERMFGL